MDDRGMEFLAEEIRRMLEELRRMDELRAKHWENLLTVMLEKLRRNVDEDARQRRRGQRA